MSKYRKTKLLLIAPALLAGVLAILANFTPVESRSFYDEMLFHPRKEYRTVPVEVGGVPRKDVSILSRGEKLKGWYFELPNSDKIVLVSEGNGGNMVYLTQVAELLLQCNASVLLYDYEGYGESGGNPSLRRICDDGLAAFDYMKKSLAEDKKVVLLGVSLGTGVSCQIAARRKVDAIILTAPFTSLLNMARQKNGFVRAMPTFALPRQHLDNVAVLSKPHPPLLIFHGDVDTMIPISESEKLFEAASEPKTFVKLPKAGHNDIFRTTKTEYLTALKTFLSSLAPVEPLTPNQPVL
jgi:fermentation-respiration switch protein FrsA (DUF1100 family)